MTNSLDPEPWRGLPPRVADLIEAEIEETTGEILETIAREVPEYARPLEGSFGRGLRLGVAEALSQFVAVIRDPDAGRGTGREVYMQLGRGEQRQGRTLDSLQAAFRVGARVAWRRFAAAGRRARVPAEPLALLAESIFAYIDELSADSVDGFAAAQAEVEDLRRRRRRELTRLLVGESPPTAAELAAAAVAARWTVPARLAALACAEGDVDPVARRLPPDSLSAVVDGSGCLLIPDPDAPRRLAPLGRLDDHVTLALGPTVAPTAALESWGLARALLDAAAGGRLGGGAASGAGRPVAAAAAGTQREAAAATGSAPTTAAEPVGSASTTAAAPVGSASTTAAAPVGSASTPPAEPGGSASTTAAEPGGSASTTAAEPGGLLRADEHLAELLLIAGAPLASRIAARRLAPLESLTARSRDRMRATALAHVRHGGNAVAMAEELQIHPQTARYRIARLRELFGPQLDDPDARFELEIALRAGLSA